MNKRDFLLASAGLAVFGHATFPTTAKAQTVYTLPTVKGGRHFSIKNNSSDAVLIKKPTGATIRLYGGEHVYV